MAAYMLDENMAKTPEKAYELMYQVWTPALKRAKEELADIQSMIDREGGDFKAEAWDWWYYSEKIRGEKFDLSEEQTKPYFTLRQRHQRHFHRMRETVRPEIQRTRRHACIPP